MKLNTSTSLVIPLLLICFGVLSRVLPHPPNVAPITALALFGAVTLPKRVAFFLPLFILFLSDLVLGWYGLVMMAVYSSFLISTILGLILKKRLNIWSLFLTTLLSSMLFFIITNLAVWAWSGMYSPTWSGLITCFTAAIPFFRNSVLGDIFYTSILFGAWQLSLKTTKKDTRAAQSLHPGPNIL